MDPFGVNMTGDFDEKELINALRSDLMGEEEAIINYDSHARASTDERVRKVLEDIRDEERAHVGELQSLLNLLCDKEGDFLRKGEQEVINMLGLKV
jgi:rubrerythrin